MNNDKDFHHEWIVDYQEVAGRRFNSIDQTEFDHDEVAREQNQDEIDSVAGSSINQLEE